MPNKTIIAEGKTTNEAIENGLKLLKVTKDMVRIKVLDTEKKSFFSILDPRVVKVELSLKENSEQSIDISIKPDKKEFKIFSEEELTKAENNIKVFLDDFIDKLNQNITYSVEKKEGKLEVTINGSNSSILIGYRGETLYALQTVISAIANKNFEEKILVIVDVEGYKEKREETLKNLALKVEKTVYRTKQSVKLEPMSAYERRIIHSTLQDSKFVKTQSIGEEPRRRVVISLK